jgi:hypothetical protein
VKYHIIFSVISCDVFIAEILISIELDKQIIQRNKKTSTMRGGGWRVGDSVEEERILSL